MKVLEAPPEKKEGQQPLLKNLVPGEIFRKYSKDHPDFTLYMRTKPTGTVEGAEPKAPNFRGIRCVTIKTGSWSWQDPDMEVVPVQCYIQIEDWG